MKTIWLSIALLLAAGGPPAGAEVRIHDSEDAVLAALGEPNGFIRSGSLAVLYFDRGKVVLRDDKVTEVELVSAEAAAERIRLERLRAAEESRRRQEAGTALKAEKLADFIFLSAPAAEQLAFWKAFSRRYPGVPLDAVDLPALAQRAAEQARDAELRQELAQLRWRLQEAEARARAAELAAQRAENRIRYSTLRYYEPGWPATHIYPGPLVSPPGQPRSPHHRVPARPFAPPAPHRLPTPPGALPPTGRIPHPGSPHR